MEESELVARLVKKDRLALAYLYDRYAGALYGVIRRAIRNEAVAEEVLQDVFLRIWDKIESYDVAKGRLFTWMINIARNMAIDKLRSKEMSNEAKTTAIDNLVSTLDSKQISEKGTEYIGVQELLKSLSEDQRFVVEQLYFRGYTQSELAEEFNIPLGTVKTRLRAALNHLRLVVT